MKSKFLAIMAAVVVYAAGWTQTSYGNLNQGSAGNGGGITNSYFGHQAGNINTGLFNIFLGYHSGLNNSTGNNNTFIGYQSGHNNQTGSGNVFLGKWAGFYETGSNKLYIDNSTTGSPLIWGDFSNNILRFNGHVSVQDYELRNVREIKLKDWDDNTGGENDKYRLLARDGAFQFFNGGVVIGNYVNGTWADLPDGRLIVEDRVGIGTIAPAQELHIVNAGNADLRLQSSGNTYTDFYSGADHAGIWSQGTKGVRFGTDLTERMRITGDGDVGIGTNNPMEKLHIYGSETPTLRLQSSGTFGPVKIEFWSNPIESVDEWRPAYIQSTDKGGFTGGLMFFTNGSGMENKTGAVETMQLVNGKVGIGTSTATNLDAMLTVKGDIHTQEVRVDLNGAVAPDYVFEPDYNLRTLAETEAYIKANKHLPEIPSAAEMEKNGVHLKEMNLKLLQKVEELTLYLIEQNKKLEEQGSEIKSLKEHIAKTEK